MLHPALQAFLDENADRFPDLTINDEGSRLLLEWDYDEIWAYMFGGEDTPSFEVDEGVSTDNPDPLMAAVEAFALRLPEDDVDDMGSGRVKSDIAPGTFGALVWTKAIDLKLDDLEEAAKHLRAERARLNPTTIADLPLFATSPDRLT